MYENVVYITYSKIMMDMTEILSNWSTRFHLLQRLGLLSVGEILWEYYVDTVVNSRLLSTGRLIRPRSWKNVRKIGFKYLALSTPSGAVWRLVAQFMWFCVIYVKVYRLLPYLRYFCQWCMYVWLDDFFDLIFFWRRELQTIVYLILYNHLKNWYLIELL